jgi:hypothetical protein
MPPIRFNRLSLLDAEEVIVEIWKCLEEYELPSPKLEFTFHTGETVTVAVRIADRAARAIISARLSLLFFLRTDKRKENITSRRATAFHCRTTARVTSVSSGITSLNPMFLMSYRRP